jgi:Skp family chaperone for outer membrane proteins
MKTVLLIAVTLMFAISAFAQPAATATVKVMFINTEVFKTKDGIAKYTSAATALEREFEVPRSEIRTMLTRHDTLAKELTTLQDQINKATGNKEALLKQFDAKVEEGQSLEVQIKRKQEDGAKRYESRKAELMDPIRQDIGRALDDFARQRGYAVILDSSKLTQAILVYDAAKADVTKDFIAFYNARPATAIRP